MSFRELKAFTEIMRALGFPRPISMENFRTPNFALVAEIMDWLVHKYEPAANIPESLENESARIAFLTAVAATIASKARILLKTKNLYAADGRAVKEMLKVARVLYSAMRTSQESLLSAAAGEENDDATLAGAEGFTFTLKPTEVQSLRAAASEITESGAKLHDLLRREVEEIQESRAIALKFLEAASGNLHARAETEFLERSIRDAISLAKDNIANLERQLGDLVEDEKTLENKLSKKKQELTRAQKRLDSLSTVRPAFIEEYEKLERELAEEYEGYVTRHRNLAFLQHELELHNKQERSRLEAANRAFKKLQKKLKEEEMRAFRGDENVADDAEAGGDYGGGQQYSGANSRASSAARGAMGGGSSTRGSTASSRGGGSAKPMGAVAARGPSAGAGRAGGPPRHPGGPRGSGGSGIGAGAANWRAGSAGSGGPVRGGSGGSGGSGGRTNSGAGNAMGGGLDDEDDGLDDDDGDDGLDEDVGGDEGDDLGDDEGDF